MVLVKTLLKTNALIQSRLAWAGLLLFFINCSIVNPAEASCMDLLRGKPAPLSVEIFERSLNQPFPVRQAADLTPEELLGALSSLGEGFNLLQLLQDEFQVESLTYGSRFRLAYWPYHILVLKKPKATTPQALATYALEVSRFLFEEKRRRLRYTVHPGRYLEKLEAVTTDLEKMVYPALAILHPEKLAETRQRFAAFRLTLRSVFMIAPSTKQLWPWLGGSDDEKKTRNRRMQSLHWGLSRTFAALYIAAIASSLSHLPDSIDSFKLLYQIRYDLIELGEEMAKGSAYDPRAEREKLIIRYEARIQKLEAKLLSSTEQSEHQKTHALIEDLRESIKAIRKDLARIHG